MLSSRISNVLTALKISRGTICSTPRIFDEAAEPTESDERKIDPSKDRRVRVSVETSIRYVQSKAFKEAYGNSLIWQLYRRNFKGQFAPYYTRKTCIRQDMIATGNPCPICRDEYLILDYRNTELLKQFISPHNGEILSFTKTGLCQKTHNELLVAILQARNYGYLTFDVPFRKYDYSTYTRNAQL